MSKMFNSKEHLKTLHNLKMQVEHEIEEAQISLEEKINALKESRKTMTAEQLQDQQWEECNDNFERLEEKHKDLECAIEHYSTTFNDLESMINEFEYIIEC